MQTSEELEARAKLRERLGAGARYDSAAAPADDLLTARRGTAYFARKLNELSDKDLDKPSRVAGWSRRHVVAQVSYHARSLARLAEAARQGWPEERLTEPESQDEDVDRGATLPPHALRYLFQHSVIHLDVEWRDLNDEQWDARIRTIGGKIVGLRETPALRAREIWHRALDLDSGARLVDLPAKLRMARS